jgi:hypothetical protein
MPDARFADEETGYGIAVKRVFLYDRDRDVMVAYDRTAIDLVRLLTIHPLKDGQKENRIQSGRWRIIDE